MMSKDSHDLFRVLVPYQDHIQPAGHVVLQLVEHVVIHGLAFMVLGVFLLFDFFLQHLPKKECLTSASEKHRDLLRLERCYSHTFGVGSTNASA